MFLVAGTVQGERSRSGFLDNGDPWEVREISVRSLGQFEATIVRVPKNYQGGIPAEGEQVCLEVELRYNRLILVRRQPEAEAFFFGD